jgi:Tol biopolymer transport system component
MRFSVKHKYFFLFFLLSVALLDIDVYEVWAEAPTTAKIVYSSWRDGNMDIFTMNPDGSEEVQLTHHLSRDGGPKWSPTGEKILFSSNRDGAPGDWDLYLMDADGSNVRRVFEKEADRSSATWSPDGKQIAYSRWEQGKFFIYIAPIDGKKEERIALGSLPAWSPDGTEIAFSVGAPRDPKRISLLNVRTRKHKFFFPPKGPAWVRHHSWSPEGDRLAFAWYNRAELRREDAHIETIYILNRVSMETEQIVGEDGGGAVNPVWSPRGDELLYEKLDTDNRSLQIFKIAVDGGPPVRLTNPNFWYYLGDWFDPTFALPVAPKPHLLTTTWGKVKQQ